MNLSLEKSPCYVAASKEHLRLSDPSHHDGPTMSGPATEGLTRPTWRSLCCVVMTARVGVGPSTRFVMSGWVSRPSLADKGDRLLIRVYCFKRTLVLVSCSRFDDGWRAQPRRRWASFISDWTLPQTWTPPTWLVSVAYIRFHFRL